MADDTPIRDPNRAPPHPGEILREDVLSSLGLSVTTTARQLGVTRQTLHRVLAGTASVSPEMALRIGKFCGNGPGIWLRMQNAHDLWLAERHVDLSAIPTHRAAWLKCSKEKYTGAPRSIIWDAARDFDKRHWRRPFMGQLADFGSARPRFHTERTPIKPAKLQLRDARHSSARRHGTETTGPGAGQ